MKKIILLAFICLLTSCQKETAKPEDPVEEVVPEKPEPKTLLKKVRFSNVSDKKLIVATTEIEIFYKENTSVIEKATRRRTTFSSDGKITSSSEEIMTFKHNEDDLIRSSVLAPNPPNSTDPLFSEYIYNGKQLDYSTNSVGVTQKYKYDAKGNILTIFMDKYEYYYTYNDRTLTEGKYFSDRGTHFFEFSKYKNPIAGMDPVAAGFVGLISYGLVTEMVPVYLQANYMASKTYSPTPSGGSSKIVFNVVESKNDYPLKAEATGFTSNLPLLFEYEYLNL